jgi:antitoxin HicB
VRLDDAITTVQDAVDISVRGRIKDQMLLSKPTLKTNLMVELSAFLSAKASLYLAFKESNLTKSALALKMGRSETEIRRILDPNYGTKLNQLDEMAAALGKRLVIGLT